MTRTAAPSIRILMIDDQPDFLETLSLPLRTLGEVTTLSDPASALPLLEQFQVILTDFRMTPLDGNRLIEEAGKRAPCAPVILLTGFATKEVAIEAANLHVFAILEKPVTAEKLVQTVTDAIREHHRRMIEDRKRTAPFRLCPNTLTATVDRREVQLTPTEFRLLSLLHENRGKRVSRERIHARVWDGQPVTDHLLDTHLGNLKKKIPGFSALLRVIRGRGYILGD